MAKKTTKNLVKLNGSKVQELRCQLEISQVKAAKKLRISPGTLSRAETFKWISYPKARLIAEGYSKLIGVKIEVDELIIDRTIKAKDQHPKGRRREGEKRSEVTEKLTSVDLEKQEDGLSCENGKHDEKGSDNETSCDESKWEKELTKIDPNLPEMMERIRKEIEGYGNVQKKKHLALELLVLRHILETGENISRPNYWDRFNRRHRGYLTELGFPVKHVLKLAEEIFIRVETARYKSGYLEY